MKFPIIILPIIILISCTKDISNQFIQPPKYKGDDMSEVFPYVKYTSVKSYSFNSPDTIYIANRKIPIERIKLFKDSLENTFWEDIQYENFIEYDEMVYKHINDSLFKLQYGTHGYPLTKSGKLVPNATYHGKFNRKEVHQLSNIFRQDTRPRSEASCLPVYRDAILFFDNDKIVASIFICFSCKQLSIYPKPKDKFWRTKEFWEELSSFLEKRGHNPNYNKHWR